MLLNPIVDQLDNIKIKIYEDRVVGHFIPCLISLALAVKDDSAWKTLNYQLLLKTRDKSAKVLFLSRSIDIRLLSDWVLI